MKVVDVASGKSLAVVPVNRYTDINLWSFTPRYLISDDGCTLIVANPQEKSWLVQFWTMPPHPPWTWVVGPPLGILFIAGVGRRLKRRPSGAESQLKEDASRTT